MLEGMVVEVDESAMERYLENGELSLVRESLRERDAPIHDGSG